LLSIGIKKEVVAIQSLKEKYSLALVMACERKAPTSIISQLVKEYPEAASIKDANGNYPLSIACQLNLPPAAILHIIEAYPEALDLENAVKKTPRCYKQLDINSVEYVTRSVSCWRDHIRSQTSNQNNKKKIEYLQETRDELKKQIDRKNDRIRSMQMAIDDLENRVTSISKFTNKFLSSQRQLIDLEGKTAFHIQDIMSRCSAAREQLDNNIKSAFDQRVTSSDEERTFTRQCAENLAVIDEAIDMSRNNLNKAKECIEVSSG